MIALERFLSVTKTSEPFLDLIKRNYSSVMWHASLFVGGFLQALASHSVRFILEWDKPTHKVEVEVSVQNTSKQI